MFRPLVDQAAAPPRAFALRRLRLPKNQSSDCPSRRHPRAKARTSCVAVRRLRPAKTDSSAIASELHLRPMFRPLVDQAVAPARRRLFFATLCVVSAAASRLWRAPPLPPKRKFSLAAALLRGRISKNRIRALQPLIEIPTCCRARRERGNRTHVRRRSRGSRWNC